MDLHKSWQLDHFQIDSNSRKLNVFLTFSQKYEYKHKIRDSFLTEITGFKKTLQSRYIATKVTAFSFRLLIVPMYRLYLSKSGGLYIAYIWIHICECCMSYRKTKFYLVFWIG